MKLLEQLTTTASVPGREHRIRKLIRRETKGLFDETRVDARNTQLQGEALERFRLDQQRIANVVYRLSLAGTSVCPEHVAPVVGAVVGRRQDFARSGARPVPSPRHHGRVRPQSRGSGADRRGIDGP